MTDVSKTLDRHPVSEREAAVVSALRAFTIEYAGMSDSKVKSQSNAATMVRIRTARMALRAYPKIYGVL